MVPPRLNVTLPALSQLFKNDPPSTALAPSNHSQNAAAPSQPRVIAVKSPFRTLDFLGTGKLVGMQDGPKLLPLEDGILQDVDARESRSHQCITATADDKLVYGGFRLFVQAPGGRAVQVDG